MRRLINYDTASFSFCRGMGMVLFGKLLVLNKKVWFLFSMAIKLNKIGVFLGGNEFSRQ